MSLENKKIILEIDAETYSVIEEICAQIDEENQIVMDYLFNQTVKDFVAGYKNLKQGYVEYGSMNLEISNAFTITENEAYGHIERYEY